MPNDQWFATHFQAEVSVYRVLKDACGLPSPAAKIIAFMLQQPRICHILLQISASLYRK